jgi:hypothetical protein
MSWRRGGEWMQSPSSLDLSIKWRRVVIHVVETGGVEAELQQS